MDTEEQIGKIVSVLYKYENTISDGYGWYTHQKTTEILTDIAKDIIKELEL